MWYPDRTHYSKCGSPALPLICTGAPDEVTKQTYHITNHAEFSVNLHEYPCQLVPYFIYGQMVFECENVTLYWSIYISLGKIWSIFQAIKIFWNSVLSFVMSWTSMINMKPMSCSKFLIIMYNETRVRQNSISCHPRPLKIGCSCHSLSLSLDILIFFLHI